MSVRMPEISPERMKNLITNTPEGLKVGSGDWKHNSAYKTQKIEMLHAFLVALTECMASPESHVEIIRRFHLANAVNQSQYTHKFSESFVHHQQESIYHWEVTHVSQKLPVWDLTVDEDDLQLPRIKAEMLVEEVRKLKNKFRRNTILNQSYTKFCEQELTEIASQSGLSLSVLYDDLVTGNYSYQGIKRYEHRNGKYLVCFDGMPPLIFPDKAYFLKIKSEQSDTGYHVHNKKSEMENLSHQSSSLPQRCEFVAMEEEDPKKCLCYSLSEYITRRYFHKHAESVAEQEVKAVLRLLSSPSTLTETLSKQDLDDEFVCKLLTKTTVGKSDLFTLVDPDKKVAWQMKNMGSPYFYI